MVARHLRRRTSSKPILGHRASFNEEAVDHRCANAGSTALTQRCLSILCYLGTANTPLLPGPSLVKSIFRLKHIFITQEKTTHSWKAIYINLFAIYSYTAS